MPQTDGPIDALPAQQALGAMLASHARACETVATALPQIEAAAARVADCLSSGHRLHYAAAGSSGLMALADACELPGTFGIPQSRIRIHMAGGVPADGAMPGETEDDTAAGTAAAETMAPGDLALVLSASGTTPYATAFAAAARARGAAVVAIANVAAAPLLDSADIAIPLPTGDEVLAGSTRLAAGTAQKVALNMISTLAGVQLGHVHAGRMVNLRADNAKLRARAASMVAEIAGTGPAGAQAALAAADGQVKPAILIACGADPATARDTLAAANGRLRDALARLKIDRNKT